MKFSTHFNSHVPKDLAGNLRWRSAVHRRVIIDPDYAGVIVDACAKDPLFFINGFGWTYDPRRQPFSKLPLILYPFQEEAILSLISAIGSEDILIEKSRDMGASWICISSIFWAWRFRRGQSFLFVSRVEDYVDKAGNPKAMFWKVDYLLNNMQPWLRPQGYSENEHRAKMHIENPELDSVIDGESTTGNVARGDRRTAIVLDEFGAVTDGHKVLGSTRDATKCRIFNSTPPEFAGSAFDAVRKTGIKKLRLHWSQHPIKAAGLYTTDANGGLKVIDEAGFPKDYIPILDGKLRSPWYDNERKRCVSAREIARELDINYEGAGCKFFSVELIDAAIQKYARPPMLVGDLEYDSATGEPIRFREDPQGHLRLWCILNKEGKPSISQKLSAGSDVAAGTGASNSALEGWGIETCEKIFEYANPHIRPEEFATQTVAICRWFGNAFLIWESGGPGRQFGSRVIDLHYGNYYLRVRDEAISGKVSDIPGVAQTKETKLQIMGEYRAAVEKGEAVNYSKDALEEVLDYIYGPDGGVLHSASQDKSDPSGAKSNHGDRAMADALGWKGCHERAQNKTLHEQPEIPVGSLAWRNQMREMERQPNNRELDSSWR